MADLVSELKPGASCSAECLSLDFILLCVELPENVVLATFDLLRFFSLKSKHSLRRQQNDSIM